MKGRVKAPASCFSPQKCPLNLRSWSERGKEWGTSVFLLFQVFPVARNAGTVTSRNITEHTFYLPTPCLSRLPKALAKYQTVSSLLEVPEMCLSPLGPGLLFQGGALFPTCHLLKACPSFSSQLRYYTLQGPWPAAVRDISMSLSLMAFSTV